MEKSVQSQLDSIASILGDVKKHDWVCKGRTYPIKEDLQKMGWRYNGENWIIENRASNSKAITDVKEYGGVWVEKI